MSAIPHSKRLCDKMLRMEETQFESIESYRQDKVVRQKVCHLRNIGAIQKDERHTPKKKKRCPKKRNKHIRQRSSNDTKQNSFVVLIQRSASKLRQIGHIFPILIHRKIRIEIVFHFHFIRLCQVDT